MVLTEILFLDDSDNFYKINVLSAVRKTGKMLNKMDKQVK